jgi:hypothetical protein
VTHAAGVGQHDHGIVSHPCVVVGPVGAVAELHALTRNPSDESAARQSRRTRRIEAPVGKGGLHE